MAAGLYDTTGWVQEMQLDNIVDAIELLGRRAGSKILIEAS